MLQRLVRHAATLPATIVAGTALVVAIGGRSGPTLAVLLAAALIAGLAVDRTRLARRLRTREAELTGLYVEHHTPSMVLDPHGSVRSVNRAVVDLTGLEESAFVGRDLGHVIDPARHGCDVERVRAARRGRPQLYDTRIRAADGTYRDIRVVLHPLLDEAEVVGMSVVGHDVTEELRAQQALTASEHRYRSIAERAQVGIYDVDFTGDAPRFRYVNPALSAMCGIPAQSWYDDMHVARFHVPADDQHALGIDAGHRTTTLTEPARYRWVRPGGEVRWHEAAEVPIRDAEGQLLSVQGIIHDVTDLVEERNLLEDALAQKDQAVRDLERVDAMKNTFLQSVSHELRTPLTGIVGISTTLAERASLLDADALATMHGAIQRNAVKLQTLLADLLDVDRLARGIVEPRLEPSDLSTLVWNVVSGIDLGDRRLTTELEGAPVLVDGPKFERIIENLVANAVRHTPAGATITVTTGTSDDLARLIVEDDGDGIPDDIKPSLFEPFFQGPESGRTASPGTGIGLALVARFTELHDGVVRVEDGEGGGARFVVELPVRCDLDHAEAV